MFQVCYISYPRVTHRRDPWITVTPINPRGRLYGVAEHDAMQPTRITPMAPVDHSLAVDLFVDFTEFGDNIVHSESEEEVGEFDEDEDTIPSEGSESDSD